MRRNLLMVGAAAMLVSPVAPAYAETRSLEYPAGGVALGQGWDSQKVQPAGVSAFCVLFSEARSQSGAQAISSEVTEIADKSQFDQALGISADFSVKGLGWKASAKTDYSSSIKVNSAFSSFAVTARVNNGYLVVAPPALVAKRESADNFTMAVNGTGPSSRMASNTLSASPPNSAFGLMNSADAGGTIYARADPPDNRPPGPAGALQLRSTPTMFAPVVAAGGSALEQATPPGAVDLIKSDPELNPDAIGRKLGATPSMAGFMAARTDADRDKALTLGALNGGFVRGPRGRNVPPREDKPPVLEPAPTPSQRQLSPQPFGASTHARLAASAPMGAGPATPGTKDLGSGGGYVQLTPDAEQMAASNLPRFRRVCGDFFVMAIKQGAEINGFVSITTTSREEQQKISAEVAGDGFGFSASGKFSHRMDQAASNSQLILKYNQSGGSGVTLATDKAQLIANVQNLSRAAAAAPYNYQIVVVSYDELYNWPQENDYHVPLGPFKELSREYGKWATLRDDLDEVAARPDAYLLSRTGASLSELSVLRDKAAKKVDAIWRQAQACTDAGPTSTAGKLGNGCALPAGMSIESDLPDRAKLPLPLATPGLPIELTYGASNLKAQVLDTWVKRVNEGRCRYDAHDSSYCASAFSIGALTVPPVRDKALVLVSGLGNRCLTAVFKDNKEWQAQTGDCKTTGDKIEVSNVQKFYYNPDKKDLYMSQQVDKKTMCLDALGLGTVAGTKLIFHACHGGRNQVFNVKPIAGASAAKPLMVLEGQDSKLCMDVPRGNAGSGVVLQLWNCDSNNPNMQWRIVAAN
jgi:hypothetical protein